MATVTINERLIPTKQYVTPVTGSTITVNGTGHIVLIINPAGSLLALTVAFPSSPSDGDRLQLTSSQAITTLTLNGGTIISALTSAVIGTFATYVYNSDVSVWFRAA